jgi:hypothetical protein
MSDVTRINIRRAPDARAHKARIHKGILEGDLNVAAVGKK